LKNQEKGGWERRKNEILTTSENKAKPGCNPQIPPLLKGEVEDRR